MGNGTSNTASPDSKSIALDILAKFALVLSKTKDALIADLKERLTENTSDKFDTKDLISHIDNFFNLLGYDVKGLIPGEIKDATNEVFEVSEDLAKIIIGISKKVDETSDIFYIFRDKTGDEEVEDLYKGILALIKNTVDMVKAFKKLGDMQLDATKKDWEKFVKESNFEKDFPKRLFDHVVSVFMRNASEVFSDDIKQLKDALKDELKSVSGDFKDVGDDIVELLDDALADIDKGFDKSLKTLSNKMREVIARITEALENQLNDNLKKTLELLRSFIKVEEYFKRVYTILDFMQVMSLEKVEIFSGGIKGNEISLTTDIYVIHWSRFEEMAKNPIDYFKSRYPVNNASDAQELLARLIRVAQAFGLDIPDFDSLKSMLIDLLRRLEDALVNLVNDEIKTKIKELKTVITTLLLALERIAVEAKKVIGENINSILSEISAELKLIYHASAKHISLPKGEDIKTAIKEEIESSELIKSISDIQFQSFPGKDIIKNSLESIVLPVILQKVSEFKEFGAITEEDWKKLLQKVATSFTSVYGEVKSKIIEFGTKDTWTKKLEDLEQELKEELSRQTENIPTGWTELKGKVLNNPEGLLPDKLFSKFDIYAYFTIVSDNLQKTIDFLNPETYYTKFKQVAINSFVLISNESDVTAKNFKSIAAGDNAELLKKTFSSFINSVLIESWKALRKELLDTYLRPFLQSVEAVVKSKAVDLLSTILEKVSNDIEDVKEHLDKVPDEYKNFVKDVFPIVYDATKKGIDNWQDGVKLAFKLTKPLYELINEIIKNNSGNDKENGAADKEKVAEALGIPESPNIELEGKSKDKNKVSYNLPSYSLDTDNKFLSVTLYDSRGKDGKNESDYFSISLCMFIGEMVKEVENKDTDKKEDEKDNKEGKTETGIYIIPVLQGDYEKEFNIGKKHQLSMALNAALNTSSKEDVKERKEDFQKGAIGIFFSKSTFEFLKDTSSISASADVSFSRREDAGAINIIKSKYLDFSIDDYPQTLSLGYKEDAFFFSYKGEVQKGEIVLKIREVNDFFAELLKEDIKTNFDIALIYDTTDGFRFDGSASLKLDFNLNKKIADVFTLNKLGVEVGPSQTKDSAIKIMTNSSFTIDMKSVTFYVKDLGIGANINYLKEDGSLGDFDLSPIFVFPAGMGVSINAAAVKGAGAISYDREAEEFIGVLELVVLEKVEVKALALLTMKMPDGSKGFSFIGLISVYFSPGIPLGMGFSLTGIGGAVGLNRSIDKDRMQVGVRKGEIASVFFVENIEDNLDVMLTQMGSYFPIKRNQFFFGVLARISYTEILHIDFGLLVQAPQPLQILIVGAIFVALPTKEKALVKINVYFAGGIDFDEGMWFDASIVDSEIVKIQIYGDMAFRLNWGKNKGFLFSAGGFHPAYKPDAALNIGNMKRLGMKLDYKIIKLTFESYFAITSNTVQLGAQVDLKIGWDNVGIFGYFGFDCLFQFRPFRFLFDVRMGVEARWRRWKLFSIALEFALAGPAKWNAKGTAKFKILFFSVKVNFNHSWGKSHEDNEISYIATYDLISSEYHKVENWKIISSSIHDQQVRLVEQNVQEEGTEKQKEIIMQPFDGIMFEQPVVPLGESMQRFGEGVRPNDYSSIKITKVEIGNATFNNLSATEYDFAPSLFFDLSDQDKLSSPSYEKMKNGVKIETGLRDRDVSTTEGKTIEYEIEQDEISFISGGYSMTDENDETKTLQVGKKEDTPGAIRVKSIKVPGDKIRAESPVPEVSIIDAFIQIPHRSDSGFKRHINKMQHLQKEIQGKKINKFFEEQETDFVVVSKDPFVKPEFGAVRVTRERHHEAIRDLQEIHRDLSKTIEPLHHRDHNFFIVKKRKNKIF